ncbi:MAG: YceI family protein [Gaiellaceae bacterium]
MGTTTEIRQSLPTGTWQLDPTHSSIGFEIEYMVGTFRGQLHDVKATLDSTDDQTSVTGSARVASVDIKDENLAAHLQSPEFFDAERHPELTFASTGIDRAGDGLTVHGEITIKGITRPVELDGIVTDTITDPYGRRRFGLKLSTVVDRTAFGMNWNIPLPTGKPALANEVTLVAELYFVQEA